MAGCLAPIFDLGAQFFTNQGVILAGGSITVYLAGSSTAADTYTDSGLTVLNDNPIVLDAAGRLTSPVWLESGISYKFVLKDSAGASVGMTLDNVSGVNDPTVLATSWTQVTGTPVYSSSTVFTMSGDKTATFQATRRLKAVVTSGTVYGTVVSAVYAAGTTTVTCVMDSTGLDSGLSVTYVGATEATNFSIPEPWAFAMQKQKFIRFTTGGTATAFTLTPLPVLASNVAGAQFRVEFNAAAGASPTLAVSGLTALPLMYMDNTGTLQAVTANEVPSGWVSDVYCDGTYWIVLTPAYVARQLQSVAASVDAVGHTLTVTLNPTQLYFRSTTLTDGVPVVRNVPSAISMTVSSGSTLGTVSGQSARLTLVAIDNTGTVELGIINQGYSTNLDGSVLVNTTAEGGGGAADSDDVIYTTTARTGVAVCVVGFIDITEATAGTWDTAPTLVQGAGGVPNALLPIGYGQTRTDVSGSRSSGVSYTNSTGRAFWLEFQAMVSASAFPGHWVRAILAVNGVTIQDCYFYVTMDYLTSTIRTIIQPGDTYSITDSGSLTRTKKWFETR